MGAGPVCPTRLAGGAWWSDGTAGANVFERGLDLVSTPTHARRATVEMTTF